MEGEKNEVDNTNEENGVESNSNSSSSGLNSSSPLSMESSVQEVFSSDCISSNGSEVEEKKDLGCENIEKKVFVLPGNLNSLRTRNLYECMRELMKTVYD